MIEESDRIEEIQLPAATIAELDGVRRRLHTLFALPMTGETPVAWLVVTPLGMPHRTLLAHLCADHGMEIRARAAISDWAAASTAVYVRTLTDERLQVALAFETLWRRTTATQECEAWSLGYTGAYEKVIQLKQLARQQIGGRRYRLHLDGVAIPTPHQIVRLHAVHAPDEARLAREWRLLCHMMEGK